MPSLHEDPPYPLWMTDGPSGWLLDYADWQEASCTGTPPSCHTLLDDPLKVFSSKSRWPSHVCGQVLTASLVRWSIKRIIAQHLTAFPEAQRWMDYASEHETLPIDRMAIQGRMHWLSWRYRPMVPASSDRERLFADLFGVFEDLEGNRGYRLGVDEPKDGDPETIEEAALIVGGNSGNTTWTLYFLALATNASDGPDKDLYDETVNGLDWRPPFVFADFKPSRVLMTVAGDPTTTGLIRLYRNASEWWATAMAGFRIRRPGRPKIDVHPDLIRATYWDMRDDAAGTPDDHDPTQEDVCDRLTSLGHRISPKTLRKRLLDAGLIQWPPPRPLIQSRDALL